MITDGDFANADNGIDENNIVTNTAGQRHRRNMITTGMTKGAESFLAQATCLRDQRACIAGYVIRTQQPDNSSDTGTSELAERHWRYPALESGFSTPTGHVRMPVYEARQQASSKQVDIHGT